MTNPLDVMLVSPWSGGSHRAWAEGWKRSSRHRVHLITHEPTDHPRTDRMAMAYAAGGGHARRGHDRVDPQARSSRPDRGHRHARSRRIPRVVRRTTATVPSVVYMHENQLNYPRRHGEPLDQGLAWTTWRSLVAADSVWFNSQFHRSELLASLPGFLAEAPDHDHLHLIDWLNAAVSCR